MFNRFGIKAKLFTSLLFVTLCLVVVSGLSYYYMNQVVSKFEHILKVNIPNFINLTVMKDDFNEIRVAVFQMSYDWENPESTKKLVNKIKDANYEIGQELGNIHFEKTKPEDEDFYESVSNSWTTLKPKIQAIIEHSSNGSSANKNTLLTDIKEFESLSLQYTQKVDNLWNYLLMDSTNWQKVALEIASSSKLFQVILAAIALILTFVSGWIFSTRLAKTLANLASNVGDAAKNVASGSQQLAGVSQQISSGASVSASSLEETVASIEEISSMIKQNAENANHAASLSQSSSKIAEEGEAEIQGLIKSMDEISQSSKRIEEIINVIDDISFQTNLLALNAAVEAARAGDQGKGFAVVADAVRHLAQRSASAAKDISSLIKDSVAKIDRGSRTASQSGNVLKNIVQSIRKVADLNSEIASASQEQSNGVIQIGKAMNQIDSATQQNASSSEEMASESERMSTQSGVLLHLVSDLNTIILGNKLSNAKKNDEEEQNKSNHHGHKLVFEKKDHAHIKNKKDAKNLIPFDDDAPRKVGTTDGF